MKLAFYKAFQDKATILDKTIAICSFGSFSHVELVFSDGWCYSISARDKKVRFKKIDLKPEQWEVLDLNISPEQENELLKLGERYGGLGYDYIGAIFSIAPFCIQKENKMFCSELAVEILKEVPIYCNLDRGCLYSPSELYKTIKEIS